MAELIYMYVVQKCLTLSRWWGHSWILRSW